MADIVKANIGNALHSVAPDHVVAVAEDIYDETARKYQNQLNAEQNEKIRKAEQDASNAVFKISEAIESASNAEASASEASASASASAQSASEANNCLNIIKQDIANMQEKDATDPAVIAKIAANTSAIEAVAKDNGQIKKMISVPKEITVQKASNAGLYIDTNGKVQQTASASTWKIYQYEIKQDGVYSIKGKNNSGAAVQVCVTDIDVYSLTVGTKLDIKKSISIGVDEEFDIALNSGKNLLIPSTVNGMFKLYFSEVSSIERYEDAMLRLYGVPAISWIDDDFSGNSPDAIKSIADELGIKIDFAIIPATDYSINNIDKVRQFENEGHEMLMHPIHNSWYGDNFDLDECEKSLVRTKRAFSEFLINHPNCLVYPGNSSNVTEVVKIVKRHCDFGFNCDASYNKGYEKNPHNLSRMFINTISSSLTKDHWKRKIKEAIDNNAWVVIGTHSWAFSNDTETFDNTTPSIPNLKDIIEYANELCGIRLVSEVWRERKNLLTIKMN